MHVTILGDYFLRVELCRAAVRRCVGRLAESWEIRSREVDWPDTPLRYNAEVSEYVGEPQEIAAFAANSDVIITHVAPVSEEVMAASPRLRLIGCTRGGPVNVNLAAASARRVPVVNAPGRNAQAVIEFTLGLILAEYRGIGRAHGALAGGAWQGELYRYERTGRELRGQTIGLIGFGAIAQGLTPYLRPFDLRILVYDPYVDPARFAHYSVEAVDLPTLLAESDIVSLHARVTPQTTGLLGAAELAQMKRGSYLINTARGPLLDYDALYHALASGHLGGAGLDTFALEPPPADWPLLKLPNVTVTPHIAGASQESAQRGAETVAQDLANLVGGRPLVHCVNPEVL